MAVGSILPIFEVPQAQASAPGNLYGWGTNYGGQLGTGNNLDLDVPTRMPAPPGGATDWNELEIFQGAHHTFARTDDGRLFGWGRNDWGQLALGSGDLTNRLSPVEITNLPPGIPNWNYAEFIYGSHNTYVRTLVHDANNDLVPDGRLFGWGRNDGGHVGAGTTGHITTPTQMPNLPGLSNWNDVEIFLVGLVGAIALTPDGRLFTWGQNNWGQLGLGHTNPVNTAGTAQIPISLLPNVTNWNDVEIMTTWNNVFVRTTDGRLFVWGADNYGQTGLGLPSAGTPNTAVTPTQNTHFPSGVTNWNDVEFLFGAAHTFVRTPDGRLFAWGSNPFGQLGLGHNDLVSTPTQNTNLPSGVTSWNDVEFINNVHHTFVITPDNRMFGWGQNDWGQLGLGHSTNDVFAPTENTNLPQGVRNWRDLEFFTFGHHTNFARVRPLPPLPLTKTLRLNEGTIVPGTEMPLNTPAGKVSEEATFTFRFIQRPAVRISDDPIRYSHAQVPAIANQTITIDPNTATAPVNGVFTATGNTVCIRALVYAHNPFPAGSVFVWEVYEIEDSSGLHDYPCVQIVYDTSRYQIRAYSNSAGIIEIIEVFEMERIGNNWQIVLPKLGATPFTNTYTRLVGDEGLPLHNALLISKEVEGMYADLTTQFDFTLTLTNPVLTPPVVGDGTTGPVIAQVVQRGTTTPVSPPRTVAITPGANTFTLAHNESLLIPQLPAGTSFQVTEAAHIQFAARAIITALTSGTYPPINQDPVPNTALVTGTYIIHQVNDNTAAFTNIHQWDIPTGLFITSTPWVALGAAALLAGLLATSRNRRRIEELPMVL